MLSDHTATPEQIARHLERLVKLNKRAECANDEGTAEWTVKAILRCQKLLNDLETSRMKEAAP